MAGGIGVTSKGRSGSASSQATGAVATAASGSTIDVLIAWNSAQTFTSIADNKGNSANYVQIGTERTTAGGARVRRYRCENAAGGAGHTVTATVSALTNILVLMVEIIGVLTSGAADQIDGRTDATTPFTLAAGLTTTQADEVLVAALLGNSGSNPATHAETGLGGSTVQAGAEETNGSTFWTGCMATAIKASTGTFNPSFTETGGTEGDVSLVTYKVAAAGGSTPTKGRLSLLGVGV